MKIKHMLFAAAMAVSAQAWAGDGGALGVSSNSDASAPTPPAIEFRQEGDHYVLDLKDGREATLFQAAGAPQALNIGLQQTENTCDYQQVPSSCTLQMQFAAYSLYFKWSKHPDPKKIGKIVIAHSGDNFSPEVNGKLEDDQQTLMWYTALKQPEWKGYFKSDRLVCNNLDWTKLIPKNNSRLVIQSWTSEINTQNKENNTVNENETFEGVFNAELVQIDGKTLQFDKFGADSSVAPTFAPYIGLQTSTANFLSTDGRVCQVSFQVDDQNLTAAASNIGKVNYATEKPLTVNTIYNTSQVNSDVSSAIYLKNWSFE